MLNLKSMLNEVSDGQQVRFVYDSYHSDGSITVDGTVTDGNLSGWTKVVTGEDDTYLIAGFGHPGYEIGAVVKNGVQVGTFNYRVNLDEVPNA